VHVPGRSSRQGRRAPRRPEDRSASRSAHEGHRRRPIRRYPDLVVHRALLRKLGAGDDPPPADLGGLAEHTSAREREAPEIEYLADDVCLAWLLERELLERGWEAPWTGEITGAIPSGLFVRFGEVFEGYLPARRLPGDYFELNTLGTALAGRRSGGVFRLGDPIEVVVEEIRRAEGKVELSLAKGREAPVKPPEATRGWARPARTSPARRNKP
jgi:ribonuclease R